MTLHRMPKKSPLVRVSELDEEVIVLAYTTREIHRLDPATRYVLDRCDGTTPVAEVESSVRAEYGVSEGFVWQALGAFRVKQLLSEPWEVPEATRRAFIAKYGTAAVLAPLVLSSMVAPAPAEASSRQIRPRPRPRPWPRPRPRPWPRFPWFRR